MKRDQVRAQEFVIMWPSVRPGNGVLEAIFSLFYLPLQYEMILPLPKNVDPAYRSKITSVIKENGLTQRVRLVESRAPSASPEAFASAVLRANRPAYQ
jgi:hypothetical protein